MFGSKYNPLHQTTLQWIKYGTVLLEQIYRLEGQNFNEQILKCIVLPCNTQEYPRNLIPPLKVANYGSISKFKVSMEVSWQNASIYHVKIFNNQTFNPKNTPFIFWKSLLPPLNITKKLYLPSENYIQYNYKVHISFLYILALRNARKVTVNN